jgi:hypothetical protein
MRRIYLLTFLITVLSISCYYDNKEELYPETGNSCDTITVKYSVAISDIITSNCLNCHGSTFSTLGGGYNLTGYNNVKINEDKIRGSINFQSGYSPMPKNSSKLDNCLLAQYRVWKNNGGINN